MPEMTLTPPGLATPRDEESDGSGTISSDGQEIKRKCVTTACIACRRRKSKCDGGNPCTGCRTLYGTECNYIDDDHRRKHILRMENFELHEQTSTQRLILSSIRGTSDYEDIVQHIRMGATNESLLNIIKTASQQEDLSPFLKQSPIGLSTLHDGTLGLISSIPVSAYGCQTEIPPIMQDAWTTVTQNNSVVNHLFSLYDSWQHQFNVLFSWDMFIQDYQNKRTSYCSSLLVNAVLALACHFSNHKEARANHSDPSTAGNHYSEVATACLENDGRSCLTTVQALGVMSIRLAMVGDEEGSYRYRARMAAMIVELELHLPSPNLTPSAITTTEIEVRRITFSGCFNLDTSWAMAAGRMPLLPKLETEVKLFDKLESKSWLPFADHREHDSYPQHVIQACHIHRLLQHRSRLSEIIHDMVTAFHTPGRRLTSTKVLSLHSRFSKWFAELPDCMLIKATEGRAHPTPQILSLHMHFHTCIITLFKPFLGHQFTTADGILPQDICTNAANDISHLLRGHQGDYGLRRCNFVLTHSILSAATIHLLNLSSSIPWIADKAAIDLAEAISGLLKMSDNHPWAHTAMHVIYSLCDTLIVPPIVQTAILDARLGHLSDLSVDNLPDMATAMSTPPLMPWTNPAFPPAPFPADQIWSPCALSPSSAIPGFSLTMDDPSFFMLSSYSSASNQMFRMNTPNSATSLLSNDALPGSGFFPQLQQVPIWTPTDAAAADDDNDPANALRYSC